MLAFQKLQEINWLNDEVKIDIAAQSIQDNELAKNSIADFNSTTDGLV